MDDVKLELKSVNKRINSLKLVQARAALRVKQRVRRQQENEELQRLEQALTTESKPKASASKTDK